MIGPDGIAEGVPPGRPELRCINAIRILGYWDMTARVPGEHFRICRAERLVLLAMAGDFSRECGTVRE